MTFGDGGDKPREFASVEAFVNDWLAPTYRRDVALGTSRYWCVQWQEHSEAVSRLTGLWHAYESLALTDFGPGLSLFWRDHVDPCMTVLFGADGPFSRCGRAHSDRLPALPTGGDSA